MPGQEGLRVRWGCDADALTEKGEPRASFRTSCTACSGYDPACGTCRGSGEVSVRRCPASLAGVPWVRELMAAYINLDRFGAWPAAGDPGDQSAFFAQALRLIERERGLIQRELEEGRRRGPS